MVFKEIEILKHERKKLITLQRLEKFSARKFQRHTTRSKSLHGSVVRRLTNRREMLRLIEMVLKKHNELKRMYAKVANSEVTK